MQSWAQKHECLHLVYAEYDVEAFGREKGKGRIALVPVSKTPGGWGVPRDTTDTWDHTDPRTNHTTHKHPSQPVPTHIPTNARHIR